MFFIHVTWLPYIGATGEIKTKPTQHSVAALRSIGISPNMIIARSDYPIDKELCDKIALFCDVEKEAVVPMVTSDVLYEVPLLLERAGVGDYLVEKLNLKATSKPDMKPWEKLVERVRKPKPTVKIALVGKYVELQDAYMSVREALKHAALANDVEVEIGWVHSADLEKDKGWDIVQKADGILVPGGFGSRGIEGKIMAARYAREKKVSLSRSVPGDAGHVHRLRATCSEPRRCEFVGVRPQHGISRHRPDARSALDHRHGRDHAPRALSVQTSKRIEGCRWRMAVAPTGGRAPSSSL